MANPQDTDRIARLLADICEADVKELGGATLFYCTTSEGTQAASCTPHELSVLLDGIAARTEATPVRLYDPHYYEIAVKVDRNTGRGPFGDPLFHKTDPDTGLTYTVGSPSKAFIVNLLHLWDESPPYYFRIWLAPLSPRQIGLRLRPASSDLPSCL